MNILCPEKSFMRGNSEFAHASLSVSGLITSCRRQKLDTIHLAANHDYKLFGV